MFKFVYEGHPVKVKVTGAKRGNSLFLQYFDTVGWVIWPMWTRPHLQYLTKCTHLRVVGLRLEGSLAIGCIIIIIIIKEEIIMAFSPRTTRTRYKVKNDVFILFIVVALCNYCFVFYCSVLCRLWLIPLQFSVYLPVNSGTGHRL